MMHIYMQYNMKTFISSRIGAVAINCLANNFFAALSYFCMFVRAAQKTFHI